MTHPVYTGEYLRAINFAISSDNLWAAFFWRETVEGAEFWRKAAEGEGDHVATANRIWNAMRKSAAYYEGQRNV